MQKERTCIYSRRKYILNKKKLRLWLLYTRNIRWWLASKMTWYIFTAVKIIHTCSPHPPTLTCTWHGHWHRVTATRGCIVTISLSWWWARCARNINKYIEKIVHHVGHLPRIITWCTVNKIWKLRIKFDVLLTVHRR